jgi:hypothetical protein
LTADYDGPGGIQPDVVADGRIISDFYPPGVVEPGPGSDSDSLADLTTKQAQKPATETIKGYRGKSEQGILAKEPQENHELRPTIVKAGIIPFL